jgi:hypothetical protein
MLDGRIGRHVARNAVGYLALFVALGGTSYAAIKLPANSVGTKQVRKGAVTLRMLAPSARVALRSSGTGNGPAGPAGPQGQTGQQGPKGEVGPAGPAGPLTTTLPSGQTLRGVYNNLDIATAAGQSVQTAISFGFTLPTAPTVHWIASGKSAPAACPGNAKLPQASPGHLCVYESDHANNDAINTFPIDSHGGAFTAERFGFGVSTRSAGSGEFWSRGTWAVTAP